MKVVVWKSPKCLRGLLRLLFKSQCPSQKTILVCMTADVMKHLNMGFYIYALTKELHFFCSINQRAANGSNCLISGKNHRTLLPPQIML